MLDRASSMYPIYVGVLAGSLPTLSMLVCSFVAVSVQFSKTFESSAQNYCAGLILGAVAKELFPQIETDSKQDNVVGITIGFVIGLIFVNYLDYFVTTVENSLSYLTGANDGANLRRNSEDATEKEVTHILTHSQHNSYSSLDLEGKHTEYEIRSQVSDGGSEDGHDEPIIMLASQAIAYPEHRQRLQRKMAELIYSISSMEQKSAYLHNYLNNSLPHKDAE
eukprot:gene25449-28765_t